MLSVMIEMDVSNKGKSRIVEFGGLTIQKSILVITLSSPF